MTFQCLHRATSIMLANLAQKLTPNMDLYLYVRKVQCRNVAIRYLDIKCYTSMPLLYSIKALVYKLTLPEGQKDDRFDSEELEHGFERPQQVTRSKEEEEESVERQADREVIDNSYVKVASSHTAEKNRIRHER